MASTLELLLCWAWLGLPGVCTGSTSSQRGHRVQQALGTRGIGLPIFPGPVHLPVPVWKARALWLQGGGLWLPLWGPGAEVSG